MHRLAATPGGWNPDAEGVIFIDQTPAPIVVLTAADTDIQTLAAALPQLPGDFPAVRSVNLLQLQQQLTIDTYADTVLNQAQVIIVRLLGGRGYWSYGLEVVKGVAAETGAALWVLPGDDRPDLDLVSHSTVGLGAVDRLWRYFCEGGVENLRHGLAFAAFTGLGWGSLPPEPRSVPKLGVYPSPLVPLLQRKEGEKVGVLLLFYRSHYLAGNTKPIEVLCQALADRGLEPLPVYVSSLRDREIQEEILGLMGGGDRPSVGLVLNTTGFALGTPHPNPSPQGRGAHDFPHPNPSPQGRGAKSLDPSSSSFSPRERGAGGVRGSFWEQLGVPVLQVILSGGTVEQWRESWQGLTPRDIAMNVALPEVDGRIITRAVSFKAVQQHQASLETDVVIYEPEPSRVEFVADLARNWITLAQTAPQNQRIALILANYPTRDGRLANGVGLDTPESCVKILHALAAAGYNLGDSAQIPATGQDLIWVLTQGQTNDPEGEWRSVAQSLDRGQYQTYFQHLPESVQRGVTDRWGATAPTAETASFPVAGLQLGNIFVGIQPSRGYDRDPSLNYHAPDLEPTPEYLAFYEWLRSGFGAQAIVHVGKHGNLEWLPGKGLALSQNCYPEVALGALPHFYPFIVNDPGEGSQAKRRAQAVILDHLTPPMTRAELYGPLAQLEQWVDEYYEAQTLDPPRVPVIRQRIWQLLQQEHLDRELALTLTPLPGGEGLRELKMGTATFLPGGEGLREGEGGGEIWLTALDRYLCELKEAQIRDGLHIFGQCPAGDQLRDLVVAIARSPSGGRQGLTRALAADLGLDFDPLTADLGENWVGSKVEVFRDCRTIGDGVAILEAIAADLVSDLIKKMNSEDLSRKQSEIEELSSEKLSSEKSKGEELSNEKSETKTQPELDWIAQFLLPALYQTPQEITQLLRGLGGCYIPPGPSGAPSRGRPEVLPTGRNFYSVDLRGLPTESAWDLGQKAADAVIERYTQENGEYPQSLGLSVWGTSTMRTGGDDMAEALALLGVRPVWEGPSRRVVDFEILPVTVLGRPRVDVTLRISGFFRDAFPNLIDLFDRAVQAVAQLPESAAENPLADRVRQESQRGQDQGLTPEQAQQQASYRVFGSKPGAYGAGLQGLIEGQNWQSDADLARAYINWSSYAYSSSGDQGNGSGCQSHSAPEAFQNRLQTLQIVLHNQDNREHDLLDSDDYYQFQGGLTAAVRVTQGQQPHTYFGDHSRPEQPKIRSLAEEIARVYRSRVINPKWIAGAMRHGYKGAFEMAATLDYLFAYDATAHCAGDYMYTGLSDAYVLNPDVQAFIQAHNPWALRDMAERLLEAHQRGLWRQVEPERLEQLRSIVLEAEGTIEGQGDRSPLPAP
ncbi:MAG: cobaltochelatase subunit CobN [Prochlorothrix sp.]